MIAPAARSLYRSAAMACAAALMHVPLIEAPFVGVGSRLSDRARIGRFYRSVSVRFAERLRRAGTPYRRMSIAGRPLTVDVTEFTTYDLYFNRTRYEPITTDFVVGALKPGDVFVDIGANHGYFTLIAASQVGPSGRVYAFEPNPLVFGQLAAHVRLNGFDDRVRLSDAAQSDRDGEATFFVSQCRTNSGLSSLAPAAERLECGALSSDHTLRVRTETFDGWYGRTAPGRIAVLKIDVEGAEDRVLNGMTATLRSGVIQSIVCEADWDGVVHRLVVDAGYVARRLESGSGFANIVFERQA